MIISTIGYEGVDIAEFLDMLSAYGIDTIVDVRQAPISRKPGFSKTALAAALGTVGVEYVHMARLGCPKSVRDRYRENGSWPEYSEGFLAYLATQGEAVRDLSRTAQSSDCALLCFEADYRFCHRSMVAEAVRDVRGAEIRHIDVRRAKEGFQDRIALPLEAFA